MRPTKLSLQMKKDKLLNFIQKYYLDGLVDTVLWKIEDKTVTVHALGNDRSVRSIITCNEFDLPDHELIVVNTNSLVKLLGAVDDEFSLRVDYHKNKPTSLKIEDSAVDVNFLLGHPSLVTDNSSGLVDKIYAESKAPIKTQGLVPDLKFELDKETMNRFIKGKNALGNICTRFALLTDDNKIDIILNYDKTNTTRIQLSVEGEVTTQLFDPVFFNVDIVGQIFNSNKNFLTATFEATSKGLLILTFTGEDWNSIYLVPALQNV